MRKASSPSHQSMPLNMVGSSTFGRYPKISVEKTYNLFVTDGWLTPLAGYKKIKELGREGRGIFNSTRFNRLIAVVDSGVWIIDKNNNASLVHILDSSSGNVYIDENEKNEIGIADGKNIYIYNYITNSFSKSFTPPADTLDFSPGYIAYQTGTFISVDTQTPTWRLCDAANSHSWPTSLTGTLQTEGDNVQAAVPFPSRGNLIMIFGKIVSEFWTNIGLQLFPYQKNTAVNINYGTFSPATIAAEDQIIAWLGGNRTSGPVIMYTNGSQPKTISTDGINYLLATLVHPEKSFGFMFKQDGHLFYQITFYDRQDNLSLIYDFNTDQIYHVCDENQNFHKARQVAFFNNTYYFLSFSDGNLYEMNSKYTTFDGNTIPRFRVCKSIRLPDASNFIVPRLNFTIEQGTSDALERVDLSISRDGGMSFGNNLPYILNPIGEFQNRFDFFQLGMANDFTAQFRFWGKGRFVATDGTVSIYQ